MAKKGRRLTSKPDDVVVLVDPRAVLEDCPVEAWAGQLTLRPGARASNDGTYKKDLRADSSAALIGIGDSFGSGTMCSSGWAISRRMTPFKR